MVEVGHGKMHSGSVRSAPPGSGTRGAGAHAILYGGYNRDIPKARIAYARDLAGVVDGACHGALGTVMGDLAAADLAGASCDMNEYA